MRRVTLAPITAAFFVLLPLAITACGQDEPSELAKTVGCAGQGQRYYSKDVDLPESVTIDGESVSTHSVYVCLEGSDLGSMKKHIGSAIKATTEELNNESAFETFTTFELWYYSRLLENANEVDSELASVLKGTRGTDKYFLVIEYDPKRLQ